MIAEVTPINAQPKDDPIDRKQHLVDGLGNDDIPLAANADSDVANANRFIFHLALDLIYCPGIGWFRWNGSCWVSDPQEPLRKAQHLGRLVTEEVELFILQAKTAETLTERDGLMRKVSRMVNWARQTESRPRIESAIKLAESRLSKTADQFDSDPWLLNVNNGTLDLRHDQIKRADPNDLITKKIHADYDAKATCPVWEKTLARVLNNDPELISYFQRICGYLLTGSVQEQVIFIFFGVGANGKSTVIGILQSLLGDYAKQCPPNLLLSSGNDRHPTELADLMGARLVVASETPDNGKLNESLVKQLTGGDVIKGRFMRQNFFEFPPTHKLVICTNHKPIIQGSDHGIWRRIHLVPFEVVIPKEEQDSQLQVKLAEELPGILYWCLMGFAQWKKDGLKPPQAVRNATRAYKQDQDVLSRFIDEHCIVQRSELVTSKALYGAYTAWCNNNGEKPKSNMWMSQRLQEMGVGKERVTAGTRYLGIGMQIKEDYHNV